MAVASRRPGFTTDVLDNVQILGLIIQALGAALIGLLCFLLGRVVQSKALVAWWRGWCSLAAALLALLLEQAVPRTAPYALPGYLFGEYLFGYWLVEGCAHFVGRPWPGRWPYRGAVVVALLAAAIPQWVGYGFDVLFPIQSLFLCGAFLAALYILQSAREHGRFSAGLLLIRAALLLLVLTFALYVPIFLATHWQHVPLPMTFLKLSSVVHLVLEFLLGFGGAVVVLEQSHSGLVSHNALLVEDSDRLRHRAERDALTGAYNRHAFSGFLHDISAIEPAVRGTVAMIDIDGFKRLNDTLGHVAGDVVLVEVAGALAASLGAEGRLFRWGGDEFLVVSFGTPHAQLEASLRTVNAELPGRCGVGVQLSVGVAEFVGAEGLQQALEQADQSMYRRRRATDSPGGYADPALGL